MDHQALRNRLSNRHARVKRGEGVLKNHLHVTPHGLEFNRARKQPLEWFYRHVKRLIAEQGFPAPERAIGNVWDPRAIERWQDRRLPANLRDETKIEDPGPGVVSIDAVRSALHERLDRKLGR